jgi:hypothetical protein
MKLTVGVTMFETGGDQDGFVVSFHSLAISFRWW